MIDLNDAPTLRRPAVHYDLDAIVARLRETAEYWVPRLFPNGRRVGDEWRLANVRGDAPGKNGSCVIALKGPRAGDWIDFDGGDGGGPLNTIEHGTGLSGQPLLAEAADIAGWTPDAPKRQAPPPQPPKRDATQEIAHIMARAVPAAGTHAERYLAARGLVLPQSADLLFHPDLTHWETRRGFPALIGVVRDTEGNVTGLHRTYLTEASEGEVTKAAVAKPRMMLGRIAGGAVRLGAIGEGSSRLALCEGIETGLAVMTAEPELPVWATLSTSGLEQVKLPPDARDIVILADNDSSGAGLRAAETAARRLRAEGREVAIAMPPQEGDDFNNLLLREGPEAVLRVIETSEHAAAEEATALQIGQHRPINFTAAGSPQPVMRADEGNLARAVERVWSLLLASNRTPWLFRYAGIPTWVVPDDEGRPVAATLTDERLRHMLARLADWRRLTAKDELVPAPPPIMVVKSVLATPDPSLPVLLGIVNTPVFGRNGTLLTEPGYHPDARLLYVPSPGFVLPPIPKHPSPAEVEAARALICDDLLGEFPFVTPAERAHAIALLLLGFLRAMVDGPTPLHMIEKPSPGTGATLMVDSIAFILTGARATVMVEAGDDDEWRKRVTAKLREVPSILLIDNIRLKLDSAAVAAALTAPFWEDRILGQSEMVRLPIRCLWIATSNNPDVSNEMARRLVRIRLNANVEHPWQRTGFRHPDLMTWVRANRARLVAACLTLCQAWIAAGRPHGSRSIGSYENWAHILGGVLDVAGIDGFLGNIDEMIEASDSEGTAWSAFINAWWTAFGTAEVGTAHLHPVAMSCEPTIKLNGTTEKAQKTSLGMALGKMRDRVFSIGELQVRLQQAGTLHRTSLWQLVVQGGGDFQPDPATEVKSWGPFGADGDLCGKGPHAQAAETKSKCVPCVPCVPFSDPYYRMHARARDSKVGKRSPRYTRYTCGRRISGLRRGTFRWTF